MKDNFHWKVFKRMMFNIMIEFAVPLCMILFIGFFVLCIAFPWIAVMAFLTLCGMSLYSFWQDAKSDILSEENE